jgi:hypothetical protein
MAFADYVMLLAQQDELSALKLLGLLRNIDCTDSNRFSLVINKFQQDAENSINPDKNRHYPPTELFEFDFKITPMNGEYTAGLKSMHKLSQFFI